ncbi:MAG: hypothetical protein HDR09_16250 [Lachnospiraceae bacterium]|nr:hypothetical protein [Lachnospiraceae bacterium]
MIVFWVCFHSIMFLALAVICMFTEIANTGKEIRYNEKHSNDKKEYYIGEKIMMMIIILAVVITILFIVIDIIIKNQTAAVWFCGVFGIVYVYIAVKQVIKMIFIPEKREFSFSDIKDFIYTYMVWWLMVFAVSSIELGDGKLDTLTSTYGELVKIGLFLFWCYFNVLYALGGLYILLYYLWIAGKNVATKFNVRDGKVKNIVSKLCDLRQRQEKYNGLRSFRLWKENNRKGVAYKIFMTIPLLMIDIGKAICLFAKYFVRVTFMYAVVLIFDPIRVLYKGAKNLWNRHKNNEWMFLLAQISGLLSYVIVFLIIQYGEYEEATKKIYEFVGTIVLIPYFFSKIANLNKDLKEEETEENIEGEKEYAIPENMVYNEDGEGVINGKSIRQLEYEAMQDAANDPEFVKTIDNKKMRKEIQRAIRDGFRKKVKEFIKNNVEIIVGICISVFLVCMYFIFKDPDTEQNISLIGSIIGAEGAMLSILISIAFMKKSNEKALDASVLPYLTVKKEKNPNEDAYAFEYIKDTDKKRDFSIWRTFDFNTIRDDKIKLVRNGVAYLHIKNMGIGPAIYLKMKIENFSCVFLPIDYLRPNDELYLIMNFNNPDKSCKTDIIFEYETIRGERHTQRFHANITWHLDRTNFTLF